MSGDNQNPRGESPLISHLRQHREREIREAMSAGLRNETQQEANRIGAQQISNGLRDRLFEGARAAIRPQRAQMTADVNGPVGERNFTMDEVAQDGNPFSGVVNYVVPETGAYTINFGDTVATDPRFLNMSAANWTTIVEDSPTHHYSGVYHERLTWDLVVSWGGFANSPSWNMINWDYFAQVILQNSGMNTNFSPGAHSRIQNHTPFEITQHDRYYEGHLSNGRSYAFYYSDHINAQDWRSVGEMLEFYSLREFFRNIELYHMDATPAQHMFLAWYNYFFSHPAVTSQQQQRVRFETKQALLEFIKSKNGSLKNQVHFLLNSSQARNGLSENTHRNLYYLQNLQQQTNQDTSQWNIVEMFFDDSARMEQPRGEINQVFFAPRTPNDFIDFTKVEIKPDTDELKESLKAVATNSFVLLKLQAENLARGKEQEVNKAFEVYTKIYKEFCVSQRVSAYLQAPRSDRANQMKSQVEKIIASGLFSYEGIEGSSIVFNTLQEVICRVHERDLHWEVSGDFRRVVNKYVRDSSGTYTINYGMRKVKVDLNNFECRVIEPLGFGKSPYREYTHHYSPRNDRFCVGLEANKVKEMFKMNDISNLLRLIYDLMTTYNREGNPHRRIDWAVAIEAQKIIVAKLLPVFLEAYDENAGEFGEIELTEEQHAMWKDYLWLVRNANMGICYDFTDRVWVSSGNWSNPLDEDDDYVDEDQEDYEEERGED